MIDWSPADTDELSPAAREYLELLLREEGVDLDGPEAITPRGAGATQLSFAQQRLWFLAQLEPESAAYNVPAALRLTGPLDVVALARSLREVVRRHEVLRTAIHTVDGQPLAEAAPADEPFRLPVVDLSGLAAERRLAEAGGLADREALRAFDLAQAPLLRGTLVVLAPAEHLALLTMHHVVSDGWSVGVLVREMGALYEAFLLGRPSPLPPLPIQYADYAAWQRQQLTGELLERQLAYWRERLAGAPPVTLLPADRPRPPVRSLRGARLPLCLPAPLGEAVDAIGLAAGATPFMTLVAAVAAWLSRLGGGDDLVLGSPIANRTRAEIEGLIGFFANTIVLRTGLGGNPSWRDLLARVREATLGAYENQDLPFERLVEELAVRRDTSYNPLFQVMVALQNAPVPSLSLAGLTLGDWDLELSTARFDLVVELEEERRWQGGIEYATDLFDATTVERMASHLAELVRGVIADPDRRLSELPLLSPAERQHLALDPLAGLRPYPAEVPLHRLFEHQVARTPAAVAVTGEGGALTYAGLDGRANRLAARLRRLGVGPEVRVALWLDRTVELVVAILGVLKAGGAYVPIDPSYPEDRLRFLLEDADAPVLVSVEELHGRRGRLDVEGITTVLLDRLDRLDGAEAPPPASPAADLPESTAYVIYTSGSTGKPKGVPVSHANVARLFGATADWFGFGTDDVWTLFHSYAFDFSVWELWGALLHGGRLVVVPFWVSRSPEELYGLLAREQVTVLNQTPSAFHQLAAVDEALAAAGQQRELALRLVIFGGEALEPRRLAGWFARHGDRRPALVNMYGITETTVHVTFRPLGQGDLERGSVIGVPIPDLYLHLLDGEREPVPLGVAGEIHVGGAGLARGYLGRPALTAQRFVPDPFAPWPGARLYASGDLARRRPDGELEYLGRADQQVKIRGFRIEPGEIEAALASLAGVREAVVVVREDTPGDRRLVAYLAGDAAVDTLRQSLRERLPDHMVPAAFVMLPALPLTPHGKVDRKALPAPEWQSTEESHLAPRTPAEEILAGIWAELLALERVGAAGHFFDLGGHSLLATQVMSRVRGAFGVEMPLRDLFEAPVLADLAARIEAALRTGASSAAPPLVPIAPALRKGQPLPLSFAQQRLWFIDQLEPGSPLYNIPVALRLEGPLSPAVLEGSLCEIVRRHETLRTVFAVQEGSPMQVILPAAPFGLALIDLSGLPEDDRESVALTLTADEAGRPFDLARGPLLRGLLLRLTEKDHIAALTLHHIVSDGWSMGVLVREVTALYAAFLEGRPSPLAELPVQYADFAVWQRSWLQGTALESEIAYWRRQLAGLPPLLELATDRPRPAVQSYRGALRPLRLSAGFTREAEALARREGATLFMVLLAGFQALLARYSRQGDFAVGTLIAGRNRTEVEGLIGFFLNTLALRGDLTGAPSFRELLVQARETSLAAHLHQEVPFEKLVEELTPERSLAHTPLFQVMLVLQNTPSEELKIRDLRLRSRSEDKTSEHFDLSLVLVEHQGGLEGGLKYATDLFDTSTIDRLILHYERLLTTAVDEPDTVASELTLLSSTERHQLLDEWNDTTVPQPRELLLPDLFAAQVARTPDALAATFEGENLTYAQLGARAELVARHLRKLGCGPESRVGVALERTLDLLVSFLGVLRVGGVYVPLDPDYPRERLRHLLEDSSPAALLTQESLRARLPVPDRLPVLIPAALPEDGTIDQATLSDLGDDLLAYVIYTSGSTGRPKGAMVAHRGMINHLWAKVADLGLEPGCRVAQTASQCFDISVWQLLAPLLVGGSVHIAEEATVHDPELLLRFVARERITVFEVVPSMLSSMLDPAVTAGGAMDLRSLEWMLVTGEACPPDLADRWLALTPYTSLLNAYGPTECSDDVTHYERARPDSGTSLSLPIGRPIANTRIYVLDAGGQPTAPGVPGELCVAGRGVGRGYLGLPARTAQVFVPDSWSVEPGARLYHTGDLARWRTDGNLEFLGRLDHQLKVRGFRIELGEIEAVLVAQPGVREAAVMAREDTPGDQRLVAYVVGDVAVEMLRQSLRERLPEYMVPGAFVTLAALPLTPNGKIDRKALPAPEKQRAEESWLEPRTPVEEVLAGIWAELLGLERVGAADHFFDLGGHSLLATRVMSRLRSAFDVEMPLRVFFEAPTLAGLAARVEAARRTSAGWLAPPLVPIAPALREGPLPVSFAQQRLWFIDQLEPGSPLYNMPVALHAEGPLDHGVLALSLTEIVRRHEALRTLFASREGEPVQIVRPASPFHLPLVDLSGLPERGRETTVLDLTGEEAGRPFDLARGPLLRGLLLRLAESDHIVALTMHHIVSDAWSLGILIREVVALYAAFAEGRPSPLHELPVQYADFAAWQSSWLHGEALESEISFWRRQLSGLPPLLELPTDRPRPAVRSLRGASRPVRLPAGLTRQVEALGRSEGATLFMVLLAGFQTLLGRYSGQRDLAVGSPVAGRNRVEIEGLIGFFINTLVMRGDLTGGDAGGPSFRELLGRARETALAAHTHQDVPFERLVQELSPERSLAHAPLFQVMLVLQNAPAEALEIRSLRLQLLDIARETARFDLTLSLEEHDGELHGGVSYATALFDAMTIDRLIGHLEGLLVAAVATPDLPLSTLPLLSPAELRELVQEAGKPRPAPVPERCIHELFAEQAARTPAALAVVDEERAWTYAQLHRRARRLAFRLRNAGVGPDQPVILCAERGVGLVAGLLGILEAGGAYLAVEPDLPAARLELLAQDARVTVAVTERRLTSMLPAGLWYIFLDSEDLEGTEGMEPPAGEMPPAAVEPGHLAYVLYTSGSTGRPKGVMVEHRQLSAYVLGVLERLAPPPRASFATVSSFAADLGHTSIFAALLGGGCLHVVTRDRLTDAASFAELMERQPVDVLKIVPSHLAALLTAERPGRSLPRRRLVLGGEALPWSLVDELRALAPAWAPECQVFNHYGPTETTVGVLTDAVAETDGAGGRGSASAPLGRPLGHNRVWVTDRNLQLVPAGVPGELCVGGPQVTRGYLGRPDLTAERFIPDPFGGAAGERLYRTGDLVRRRQAGPVEFLGRTDNQVKIRGFRIELGEIEASLVALPGVHEALVVAREDTPGDRRLVAYLTGEVSATAVDTLHQALRGRLPEYMVPAAFVRLTALPLTANGKVNRKALPAPEHQRAAESYMAPRTLVEEVLAGIWAELLGVERVGAADSFFDLGGHSLLATRVMSRLRGALDVEMPLRDLFEAPRLSDFAARVETARRDGAAPLAPPLVPVPREAALPLSFAQQRLWFIDQLEPGSPLYNIPLALRIQGPLDPGVLALTLGEIVRRHETLRTVFAAPEGSPVQVIQPTASFVLPLVDVSELPEGRREPQALFLAGGEAQRPFDLTRGPLLRGVLIRLGEGDHISLLTMHHVASDGWSRGILVREVAALYTAFVEDKPSPLRELPIQYGDFAVWQRQLLQGEALETEIAFWRESLRGLPTLELPTDRPRPRVRTSHGGLYEFRLTGEHSTALTRFARAHGSTLFMVLWGGFAVLLSRWTGQDDIVVGSVIANRDRSEVEDLIGFFVNSLVLRIDRSGDPDFGEILERARKFSLAAFAHQNLPFEKLVEELAMERDPSRTPLFQVLFALQNAGFTVLSIPGLRLSPVATQVTTAKFDLTLSMTEAPEGLYGFWEYNRDLFDSATVERMAGHLEILLEGVLTDPGRRVSELPLLSAVERAQLLREWNDTETPCSQLPLVHDLFAAHARQRPGATALAWRGGRLTYGELDRLADRLARRLRSLGVGPETLVALCTERTCPQRVAGIVAVLKAGGAYVSLDPAYPPERLAFLLADSRAPVVLTQERFSGLLPVSSATVIHLDGGALESVAFGPEVEEPLPNSGVTPENLAYVVYTSGSTGRPKGVEIPHSGLMNLVRWHQTLYRVGPEDRGTQVASPAFDASIWELWPYLAAGSSLHIPDDETRLSAPGMLRWWAEEGITLAYLMTPLAEGVLEEEIPPELELVVRALIIGGDRLRRGPRPEAGFRLMNHYGPAEYTVTSTVVEVPPEGERRGIPTIGRPVDNTRIHVLDRAFQPVPIGVLGELYVTGIGLARGYLGRPDLTAEKFVPDPFAGSGEPGARIYRTGDLVRYLPDGDIDFQGRLDHQVKLRGLRIELGEIEAMLGQHPSLREATVLVREDRPGDRRLVAYVVPTDEPPPAVDELRDYLKERLPEYMVPAVFVTLAALPLTPNGKVDRRALPAPDRQSSAESWQAPQTPVEELLAGIWSELLGLERVGVDESFFELGGHSLLATRMVSQLRDALRLELPLRTVFEAPTVAELARRVAELQSEKAAEAMPIRPVPRDGELPLSYAQQRLWFLDRMVPDNPFYNVYYPVELSGPLDVEILRRSFQEILRRHEGLRTTFDALGGRPVQVIAPAARLDLPLIDLQELSVERRREELARLSREEAHRPFDLYRGPLWRLRVVRLEPRQHALLATLHHIVADGWSMRVLIDELTLLYQAYLQGESSPLPELPIQYADFAVWQRQWFEGELFQEQLGYWKSHLAGLVENPLELPTDHPRPPIESFRGHSELYRLPAPLVQELKALARGHRATLFMVVLAGFDLLLSRYTGQQDIGIGTGIANRNRREIEDLIGFFVNTLVLRTDLSGTPSFEELLERVRWATVEAYDHQDLPFEMLIEEINPERALNRHPLVQVMLAFQNFPRSARSLSGLSIAAPEGQLAQTSTAKFDMTLFVTEWGEELALRMQYSSDLFEVVTIRRLLAHLETLLRSVVERPEAAVSELSLLTEAEWAQVLSEWSDTAKPCPQVPLVHELFAEHARLRPESLAITSWNGGRLTYGEIEARANRLAHHLHSLGVGPEVRVAVATERTCERVIGLMAVLKAGAAFVTLDPAHPEQRLAFLLDDAGVPVLLTEERFAAAFLEFKGEILRLDADWGSIQGDDAAPPESRIGPENLAYLVYTSGSTGRPKGVEIPHAGLMNQVRWYRSFFQITPEDRGTQIASPAFDASIPELWPFLASGASVHIPDEETRLSSSRMIRWWAEQGITLAFLMTPLAEGVLDEEIPSGLPLRALSIGGDRLHRGPAPGLGFRVMNHYGPAEYSVGTSVAAVPPRGEACGLPTVGRPIDNTRIHLLGRHGEPVPTGIAGELCVAGLGLARGYSRQPDLTAEKFVPDPFAAEPGARMYRTGDLVRRLRDGEIDFLGRLDHQVKIRGFRIELGEIETVLTEHPAVAASAVLARQDPAGQTRLVAYVVYDREGETASSEMASSRSEQVADWQALYDNTYERSRSAEEASFNIMGWDSSYTREPIPAEEMREWTERTVEEILALGPKRVLEVGVGSGLLLYRIAPFCERYQGTDFSRQAITWLSRQLGESLPQVHLAERPADDFSGVAPRSFDTVVLNSVVQYFPDADYLAQVLAGAVEAVSDGGAVYVGDVRSLPLLDAFHASVELFKADSKLPLERLRQLAAAQRMEETELVLDPGFFVALESRLPRITAVEIRPKRDRADNELTRFRYQVVLRVGGQALMDPMLPWLDWELEGSSLEAVRQRLGEGPDGLALSGVPDVRVEAAVMAARALAGAGVDEEPKTAGELRQRLERLSPTGVHPEDLLTAARELGYEAIFSVAWPGPEGRFNVLFHRPGSPRHQRPFPAAAGELSRFTNNPVLGKLSRRLMPALRSYLEQRLPSYMVPSAFVLLDGLPLTPNGKVNRRALPAPEAARQEEGLATPPRTPAEEKLAAIFREVLQIEQLGVEDDFFALGGHSLLATQVISRVREAFKVELPVRSLFEAPTVAGLAQRVEAARVTQRASDAPPLAAVPREGPLPLSFAQQRLWFIDQLKPGSPLYNMPVVLRVEGLLGAGVLALTLREIVRRHEVLRTIFAATDGSPVQIIQPAAPFVLPMVDLSGLPASRRETKALLLARDEVGRPFDLAHGPLLRGVLLRLADGDHIVALTMHHIVSDGWSMGILVREVVALYAAFAEGRPSPLPELPFQYADFAVWQRVWLDQEVLEDLVAYWRRRLAGAPPQLDLPGARPRPAALSPRGAACRRRFSPSLLEQLHALGRHESATLFITLMAPLQALLHSRTGATDLVVGTDVAGRDRRETEGLIGFFINQLSLRADLAGDPTLRELLGRVREVALDAYAQQDLPFDHLVEALRLERSLQRSPVFQVKLVLQNTPQESLDLPGLTLKAVPATTATAQLDLHWNFAERGEELWLTLTYSTDLYDAPLIDGLLDEYEAWLHAFVERPEARLGDVVTELAQAGRARQVELDTELKSVGLAKLRSRRRQAVELDGQS